MTDEEYAQYRASLSMQRYSDLPVLKRPSGERLPEWACACRRPDGRRLLTAQRHRAAWGCLPPEALTRFLAAHPEVRRTHPAVRELAWMEREFGPMTLPEPRR